MGIDFNDFDPKMKNGYEKMKMKMGSDFTETGMDVL